MPDLRQRGQRQRSGLHHHYRFGECRRSVRQMHRQRQHDDGIGRGFGTLHLQQRRRDRCRRHQLDLLGQCHGRARRSDLCPEQSVRRCECDMREFDLCRQPERQLRRCDRPVRRSGQEGQRFARQLHADRQRRARYGARRRRGLGDRRALADDGEQHHLGQHGERRRQRRLCEVRDYGSRETSEFDCWG